jgi:FixJ family two-component response regulator
MQPRLPIYIVDDDPAALSSVTALLVSFAYQVRAFRSAEEFLMSDVKTTPGCLLCDIRLDRMSGLELLNTLKMDHAQLPVILISGYLDSDIVSEALANGAVAVLEKPLDPNALIAHVQAATEMFKQA